MFDVILLAILESLVGVTPKTLKLLFEKAKLLKQDEKNAELLAIKINELAVSLHKSSELMSEIEVEFANQKKLADKWAEEASISQNIASLNEEEVTAVSKILDKQLKKESKIADRRSLFLSILFCLVGLLGGYLISKYLL